MGLKKILNKVKKGFNKFENFQSEAPYMLQKKLKEGWTSGRKKSETFNKFTKGVEKAKKGVKKAYNSKASKAVGHVLDNLEKAPVLGGALHDARNTFRSIVKDPFAVKSNLWQMLQFLGPEEEKMMESMGLNALGSAAAGKLGGNAKDGLWGYGTRYLKRREKSAKDKVFKKKKKGDVPTTQQTYVPAPRAYNAGIYSGSQNPSRADAFHSSNTSSVFH